MAGSARRDAVDQRNNAAVRPRAFSRQRGFSIATFGLLLLCAGVGSALADDLGTQSAGLPTSEQVIEAIESESSPSIRSQPTDPAAAESLPHDNLGREEALELLQGVFQAQLQAPAGIFDELEVEKFLSPNVAVIAGTEPPTDESDAPQPETQVAEDEEGSDPSASMAMKEELRAPSSTADEEFEVSSPGRSEGLARIEGTALLQSSIPLRTEGSSGEAEAIDLGLEHAEGELQPENPLIEVGIPQQLGEGIELPDVGVTIKIAGAPEDRSPSIVEDSVAFLPNVAPDTDLAIAPTPTGVETFTQLRSVDSPRAQTFVLELPDGAALQATEAGGAEVAQEGETLVGISRPTAIDATGADVAVSLDVAGDSFTLTVSPEESAKFPILVDPLIQTYNWANSTFYKNGICNSSFETNSFNSCTNREEWGYEWVEKDGSLPFGVDLDNRDYDLSRPVPYGTPGLVLDSSRNSSGMLTAGDRGSMIYTVPRYFTDQTKYGARPTSFISHMTLWNLDWTAHSSSLSPYIFAGIWDPIKPGWVSYFSHEGLSGHSIHNMGWKYEFPNGQPNTNVKVGYVSIQATATGPNQYTHAYVGSASIQLNDNGAPGFGSIGGPSSWVNQSPSPISFTTSDSGLGVHALTTSTEQLESGVPAGVWKTPYGCIGMSGAACPRTWASTDEGRPALKYEPSVIPTGISYLKVVAEDPVGNKSAPAYAQVKVDHTAPQVSLAGTMTEQATLGTKRPTYTLRVDASDGTTEAPQSGVAKTVIKVDGTIVDQVAPGCATRNCAISREWTLDSSKYSAGQHTVTVIATDAVGIPTTKTLTIDLNPSPPTLALSGTMTEQATLGTSRPRYKLRVDASAQAGLEGPLTPQPTFGSSFGSLGTGSGQLSHPAGVAVDAKGNVWVVDQDNDRVQKFNEAGQYLSSFGSPGTGNGQFGRPTSIAIDAKGNIWVTDAGNSRLEKFNEKGEYLAQFGSYGTANGQFSSAEGIAIDPKGNIWVADTYNGRLQKFNANAEFLQVVGSKGSAQGQLGEPTDLDIGPGGKVWVADWQNNRVSVFDEAGQFVRQFGTAGTGNGQFNRPDVIDVDGWGNVWVGDQNNARVQRFNQSGEYLGQFGSKGSGQGQFSFGWPMGIATDSKGNIWVADTANNRIQRWVLPGYRPNYLSVFGSSGTGNGQFSGPADATIDLEGNLWIVDKGNSRLQKFNSKGEYLAQFGSYGTANGQFRWPSAIDVDPEGNLWITDSANHRVQKFNVKGEYLAQFGSYGTGNGQFNAPSGIAIAPNGWIFVTDRGNHRVQLFGKAGAYLGQGGSYGWEDHQYDEPTAIAIGGPSAESAYTVLVVDGGNDRIKRYTPLGGFLGKFGTYGTGDSQFDSPAAIDVDVKGNVWVGDRRNNRLQLFDPEGEYITQVGSQGSGQGQFSFAYPMGIATDPKGNLWITDTANNRVQRWSQANWRSEITTEIAVDGKPANVGESGCTADQCAIAREWTLDSPAYATGPHAVLVKATDGLGNTTSKSLTINIQRDTAKPSLQSSGELVEAPKGWVEQESYGLNASASDAGYGVISLAFKIDGEQVAAMGNSCADGGCEQSLVKSVDMSVYEGGAHPAELVATDGAGNVSTRKWTINVDPEGHISTEEAAATLEAVDATSPVNTVGESQHEAQFEGTVSGVSVKKVSGEIEAINTHVPATVAPNPTDGVTMEVLEAGALSEPCTAGAGSTAESEELEGIEEVDEGPAVEPCHEPEAPEEGEDPKDSGLEPVKVAPVSPVAGAPEPEIVGQAAAVTPNTASHVDTVVRPLYDGVMSFAAIRDRAAPESYSWEVNLEPDQELKLVDSRYAAVYYDGGYPALAISAEPAHDAVGTDVATSLSVSEDKILTLTVKHRAAAYVYPVVAGTGWRGGFRTEVIERPLDELEEKEKEEEEERIAQETLEAEEEGIEVVPEDGQYRYTGASVGPPLPDSSPVPFAAANPNVARTARAYNFFNCYWMPSGVAPPSTGGQTLPPSRYTLREVANGCHGDVETHYGNVIIRWAVSMSGVFHYKYGHWVWVNNQPRCRHWGHGQLPAIVHCFHSKPNPSNLRLDILAHLRFPYGAYRTYPTCVEFDGVLPLRPSGSRPYYGKKHWRWYMTGYEGEKCPWGNLTGPNAGGY